MVEVENNTNLLLRKAIHFRDKEAKAKLLEMIAANESAREKIDFSSFKVKEKETITYYDTLGEAVLIGEEDIARALMTRNEFLMFYFGGFIAQNRWDAVNLFARIYLQKFPYQNTAVFIVLMGKALSQKDLTHAKVLFQTIAEVDALTAEELRPMVAEKIVLEGQPVLKVAIDTLAPVES